MEQYEFADEKLEPVIIDGKYYQRIHNKHINSYGKNGADNIADNVIKIFQKIKVMGALLNLFYEVIIIIG